MTRLTRRALSTLTALVMVGTLFVGAPAPVRATADDIYIGYAADTSSANCTDPDFTADGVNDSAQIALAVAATNADGTLHFCPGTYDIDATIDLSGTDITLQGAAAATTILDGGSNYLYSYVGAITVSDLTFQDGHSSYGGAIWAGTATVTDSTFTNNTAAYGGAIRAVTVTVTGSTFTNNTAVYDGFSGGSGGAISAYSTATVTDSTFTNNDAENGGAIWSPTATVTASTFTNNTATTNGGAIWAPIATVTDSTFTDNTADYGGGAIYAYITATVTASTFTDNDAAYYGGAIYTATTAVTRSTFTNNTANYGGAIYAGGTATVTDSTFTDNDAAEDGGAIIAGSGTITRSRFTRNTAGGHGGAVTLWSPNSDNLQQLRRNTFTRNQAGAGGAITLGSCGPAVSRSQAARVERANRFSSNRATEQRRTNNIESGTGYCGD